MSDKARNIIVGVVTAVWAVNFGAGLIPQLAYEPDQAINGIFMTIVGSIFAYTAVKGVRSGPPPGGGGTSSENAVNPPSQAGRADPAPAAGPHSDEEVTG